MSASFNDEAVVIKCTKLGETDVISTILTRNNGKISAVVKGARSKKSKLSAAILPFNRIVIKFSLGRNLDIVNEVEMVDDFASNITGDYDKYLNASQMCNIVDKIITMSHECATNQYLLLVRALKFLSRTSLSDAQLSPNLIGLSYTLRALSLAGFELDPEDLASSGISVGSQYPHELVESVFEALMQGKWNDLGTVHQTDGLEEQLTKWVGKYATRCLETRLVTFSNL
jgi:DNA repair protein RecO (recombination protein O)